MLAIATLVGVIAASTPSEVDEVLRRHRESTARRTDMLVHGALHRGQHLYDMLAGTALLQPIDLGLKIGELPFYLVQGETIIDATKRSIEETQARNLHSMLKRSLGAAVETDAFPESINTAELDKKFNVSAQLAAVSKKELTAPEAEVLTSLWQKLTSKNVLVLRGQIRTATTDLKAVVERQKRVDASLNRLAKNLAGVSAALERFQAAAAAVPQEEPTLPKGLWDRLSFPEQVEIARACQKAPGGRGCSNLSTAQRDNLLARGEMYAAAITVNDAVSTYVSGALAIGQNLGADIPPWASKSVTGVTAAASLAAGIASKNPQLVVSGLVGLSSLFAKSKPSADTLILRALAQVQTNLTLIHKRLDAIEKVLVELLRGQQAILERLEGIDQRLVSIQQMLEAVFAVVDATSQARLRRCSTALFDQRFVGPWESFFKERISDDERDLNDAQNVGRHRDCSEYIEESFSKIPEERPFLASAAASTMQQSRHFAILVPLDKLVVERLVTLLGDPQLGVLEPILVPESLTRSELVLRFVRRSALDWDLAGASPRMKATPLRVSASRLLPAAALAAVYLREERAKPDELRSNYRLRLRREALVGTRSLLERYILQESLFESDHLLAGYATRYVEGGVRVDIFGDLLSSEMTGRLQRLPPGTSAEARKAEHVALSRAFVGDVLDALLWFDSDDAAAYLKRRYAVEFAWKSDSEDVLRSLLTNAKTPSPPKLSSSATLVVRRALDPAQNRGPLLVCLNRDALKARGQAQLAALTPPPSLADTSGLSAIAEDCIGLDPFLDRNRPTTSPHVQSARFWLGLIEAELGAAASAARAARN